MPLASINDDNGAGFLLEVGEDLGFKRGVTFYLLDLPLVCSNNAVDLRALISRWCRNQI